VTSCSRALQPLVPCRHLRGPTAYSHLLYSIEGEEVCSLTARVQRAQLHRARCASKGRKPPCPPLASYGIMPPLGGAHGAFARIRRVRAYLSWTIPRESDCLVLEADGDRVPDSPKAYPWNDVVGVVRRRIRRPRISKRNGRRRVSPRICTPVLVGRRH